MLGKEILDALKGYTANMAQNVTLVLQPGEAQKRDELKTFLTDVVSVSDKLALEERDAGLRNGLSFSLEVAGKATGIVFSGIPSGHEFSSLVFEARHKVKTKLSSNLICISPRVVHVQIYIIRFKF